MVIVDNSFDWLRFRHQIPPFRYVPLRLIFLCTYKIELLPFEWYTNGGDAVPWNVFIESKLYLKINELDELSFHLNNWWNDDITTLENTQFIHQKSKNNRKKKITQLKSMRKPSFYSSLLSLNKTHIYKHTVREIRFQPFNRGTPYTTLANARMRESIERKCVEMWQEKLFSVRFSRPSSHRHTYYPSCLFLLLLLPLWFYLSQQY